MFLFILFCHLFSPISTIPVENSVFGDVEVECDSANISVQIKTENPFIGNIFVKDYASEEPLFITKVDRTYHVVCIYKEAEKTVKNNISIDEITVASLNRNLTMPVCSYQILEGGPHGDLVHFGLIGQQVYHRWKCESQSRDIFCMLVHTCSADDGRGERAFLMDSNGCAIDRFLLSDIEYPEDLLAGQEAHVYKFADRAALFFQCQISITIKEPGEECIRPICGESRPEGGGAPPDGLNPGGPYGPSAVVKKHAQSVVQKRSVDIANENVLDVRTRLSVSSSIVKFENEKDCILLSNISVLYLFTYLVVVILSFLITIVLTAEK
uniref:ZP domain-containing protein n=1 Tax=Caenorhabditis japonica TaxID=281687 RepID=A0A8R1DLT3_CAEJA